MFNDTWFSNESSQTADYPQDQTSQIFLPVSHQGIGTRQAWLVFGAACFLVSVPVFFQAPLVRLLPALSLVLTVGWLWLSSVLRRRPSTEVWGDLLLGFTWSWLAGSIYWGWLRWEPLIHLPVEAIGLPFALWCLWQGKSQKPKIKTEGSFFDFLTFECFIPWGLVGNLFYLGSLFGTAMTDVYFYITGLIPYWRQLMLAEPALATPIFQSAIAQVRTPWGTGWAIVMLGILLGVGLLSLSSRQLHWWAFGGAVLSTILVDSLFWLVASMA